MRPKYLTLSALLLTSAGFALSAGSAHAAAADFCTKDDGCSPVEYMIVENNASVTVTSVNITQEQGAAFCEKVKKTVSRNSAGGIGIESGQTFRVSINKNCKYKVVFKTTKGCTGDKTTHYRPSDFEKGRSTVRLENGCGTLNVKIKKTPLAG